MKLVLGSPVFWAVACFAAALPWILTGSAVDFLPFVCLLVAGFFAGLLVMRALARIPSRRAGLWAHVGVSAALALFGALFAPRLGDVMAWLRQALPEPAVSLVWSLWVPTLTLTGVVWLTLLGRATAALPGGRAADLPAAVWVGTPEGAQTEFTAVEMTRRAYLWIVTACALAVIAVAVAIFVAAEPVASRLSPKLLLLDLGLGVALPVFLVARAYFRARSRVWRVTFKAGRMRIAELPPSPAPAAGDGTPGGAAPITTLSTAFTDIESFTWSATGEAARIEVRSRRGECSLLVGVAKPLAGKRAALPDLSRRVRAELTEAGLVERPGNGRQSSWRYERVTLG